MRRSVVAIGVVLSFGACGGSTQTTPPEPEPAPASIAAIEAEPESPASQDGDESSTEMMGPDQIKLGVDKLNPGIKACGQQHGLASGTKIMVKFAIVSSGAIAEAEVLSPADAELVACVREVIDAAGTTVFPRFGAAEQRFQFNFRVP